MTPLIDVMLVLLVIFMLTAPLLVSAIKVDLPVSAGPKLKPGTGRAQPAYRRLDWLVRLTGAGKPFLDDNLWHLAPD